MWRLGKMLVADLCGVHLQIQGRLVRLFSLVGLGQLLAGGGCRFSSP